MQAKTPLPSCPFVAFLSSIVLTKSEALSDLSSVVRLGGLRMEDGCRLAKKRSLLPI